jgi:hypothetical protein
MQEFMMQSEKLERRILPLQERPQWNGRRAQRLKDNSIVGGKRVYLKKRAKTPQDRRCLEMKAARQVSPARVKSAPY